MLRQPALQPQASRLAKRRVGTHGLPLFQVTCLCNEGIGDKDFRVVDAPSRTAVAELILRSRYDWIDFLKRSYLWEDIQERWLSPEEFLKKVDVTWVDCDSRYQMAIREIKRIEVCQQGGTE